MSVTDKFLRYVKIDTQSDEESTTFPSTEKQKDLGRLLYKELKEMGAANVSFDEKYGYVYAEIPETRKTDKVIGFIAHMDTSPETSGKDVKPKFVENYNGGDIILDANKEYVLSPEKYPEILDYVGKTLITTDGTTLLGADDKAGVSEIMEMAEILLKDKSIPHGKIKIGFTPDEEVGAGVDYFDVKGFGADFAYTVDGGGIGELEFENFNAAALTVNVSGVTVHPGEAKNKMKNASLIAMEFEQLLPKFEKPEYTEGYEGFFYLSSMEGETESATLKYIIRDHSFDKYNEKVALAKNVAGFLNQKYGEGTVSVEIKEQYRNMREKIEDGNMFLVDYAVEAMKELGINPKVQPIRGGTDGARLSYMGLPCPNICTGGHNFHGRFEYICVESMEEIVKLLLKLACRF